MGHVKFQCGFTAQVRKQRTIMKSEGLDCKYYKTLFSDKTGPVELVSNIAYICETDGQVTDTGKFLELITCQDTGTFSTAPTGTNHIFHLQLELRQKR